MGFRVHDKRHSQGFSLYRNDDYGRDYLGLGVKYEPSTKSTTTTKVTAASSKAEERVKLALESTRNGKVESTYVKTAAKLLNFEFEISDIGLERCLYYARAFVHDEVAMIGRLDIFREGTTLIGYVEDVDILKHDEQNPQYFCLNGKAFDEWLEKNYAKDETRHIFIAHSHVRGPVVYSQTDELHIAEWVNFGGYVVSMIVNQKGDKHARLDFALGSGDTRTHFSSSHLGVKVIRSPFWSDAELKAMKRHAATIAADELTSEEKLALAAQSDNARVAAAAKAALKELQESKATSAKAAAAKSKNKKDEDVAQEAMGWSW